MKKNLLLAAAMLFACQFTYAQTQKGQQTLGGNASFARSTSSSEGVAGVSGTTTRKNTSSIVSLGPSYGYFVNDGLELGGSLTFAKNNTSYNNISYGFGGSTSRTSGNGATNTYGASIFIRKYFMHESKIGVRVGPYAGYSYAKTKEFNTSGTYTTEIFGNTKIFNAGALLDVVYFPSNKLGIAANLAGLTYNKSKNNAGAGKADIDGFKASFANEGLTLSVFYVLGAK